MLSLHTSTVELDLATAWGATNVSLRQTKSLSQCIKPTKQCISVPAYSWQRQNRREKQPDKPLLVYLHLRVVVQCPETDWAQNWAFFSPALTFSVKNLLSLFFFGGGRKRQCALGVLTALPQCSSAFSLLTTPEHLRTLTMVKALLPPGGQDAELQFVATGPSTIWKTSASGCYRLPLTLLLTTAQAPDGFSWRGKHQKLLLLIKIVSYKIHLFVCVCEGFLFTTTALLAPQFTLILLMDVISLCVHLKQIWQQYKLLVIL